MTNPTPSPTTTALQTTSSTSQTAVKKAEEKKKEAAKTKKGLSTGAIVGIVVAALAAVGGIGYWIYKKFKKDNPIQNDVKQPHKNIAPELKCGEGRIKLADGTQISVPVIDLQDISLTANGETVKVTRTPGTPLDKDGKKTNQEYYETAKGYYILNPKEEGSETQNGFYYENATKQKTYVSDVSLQFGGRVKSNEGTVATQQHTHTLDANATRYSDPAETQTIALQRGQSQNG